MCGCSGAGAGTGAGTAAVRAAVPVAPSFAAPVSQYLAAPVTQTQLTAAGGNPAQTNVNDGSVRNAALAERSLERLKFATRNISTPAQAAAAGYHPNPSAPDHWINDSIFAQRNGYDLEHPATLMFEGNTLVGVMLSHNPSQGAPPDLGAGSWHTHGGTAGAEYAAHVWFNKPLQTAFGTETGDV
ncbi:MAG: hypothetical protein JWM98_1991 [Thermoleophilia bacterium]|nr:hypothetical protein [Thermoleophilia bacterium]